MFLKRCKCSTLVVKPWKCPNWNIYNLHMRKHTGITSKIHQKLHRGGEGGVSVSSMLPKKKASGFGGGEERRPKQPEGFKGEKKKKQMEFPMQTVQKLRGLRNKATNDSEEGAKKGRSERRRLSDCFSQAGPCSHLLSSFKGVVMVTVVGTQMWLRG